MTSPINENEELKDTPCDEHHLYVNQCEEGCGCNLLHIFCKKCDYYTLADGWEGCNIHQSNSQLLQTIRQLISNTKPARGVDEICHRLTVEQFTDIINKSEGKS